MGMRKRVVCLHAGCGSHQGHLPEVQTALRVLVDEMATGTFATR